MSNDINVTEGSGKTVATEEIGGVQYQQIKVVGGQTGSTSVMGVNPDGSINVSMIGAIRASITGGISSVTQAGAWTVSVVGSLSPSSVSGAINVSGSVLLGSSNASVIAVIQGSIAGAANQSVSGAVNISGSVMLGSSNASVIAIVPGSIAAAQIGTRITSVISANPSSMLVGASIFGQLPAGTAVLGSVAALQSTNPWVIVGSVSGAVNVAGSVLLGSSNASVIAIVQGSIAAIVTPPVNQSVSGALNISGSVLLGSSNASVIAILQSSSIIAINAGSVIAVPSGSTITVWKDSSVLAVPVGSTIAVMQGSVAAAIVSGSVVGTYAEDAAHTSGDKGLLSLNVRNDTLASVTSADGDYGALSLGPSGEAIVANAPLTKWIQGIADFRNGNAGASIVLIAASGSSIFQYVTGVQVANMGSASVLVTLAAGGSVLGYTIAPAGGGSNIYTQNGYKTPANFGFAASISGIASVLVSAQGFISKS